MRVGITSPCGLKVLMRATIAGSGVLKLLYVGRSGEVSTAELLLSTVSLCVSSGDVRSCSK